MRRPRYPHALSSLIDSNPVIGTWHLNFRGEVRVGVGTMFSNLLPAVSKVTIGIPFRQLTLALPEGTIFDRIHRTSTFREKPPIS
jgi:hypothetical protein